MTIEEVVEAERRLRELWRSDPARAVQEAWRALDSAQGADLRAAFAGVLVDAGTSTRDERSIRRGIAAIKQLVRGNRAHGGYQYMEGTAYLALAGLQPIRTVAGYEATKKIRVRARRALWEAANSAGAADLTRAQAWVNLGNDLREAGRWDEAYSCYLDAMRQDQDHPVAAGYAASILLTPHSAWSTHGAGWEPVAHYLARVAQAGRERVAVTADGAEAMFDRFPTDRADEVDFPEVSNYSDYERFVYRNRLYLAIAPDGEFHPDCWDDLTAPALSEPLDTGPNPPAFIAMFNLCKADYLLARHLGWAATRVGSDDGHLYTNTLDYASYGTRVAQTVLATRAALDVLDRVAVVANHYFGLGVDPTKVNFRQVWRSPHQPRPLLERVAGEITAGNYAMLALTSMADDLVGNGWLEGRQRFRNAATHRFVVMHSEMFDASLWRPAEEVHHLHESDLDEELFAALRTARSSIVYLHEAVRLSEIMRQIRGSAMQMYLPRLL